MTRPDTLTCPLTPSQEEQSGLLRTALAIMRGASRPLLLTGDVGVGKTFLAQRLAQGASAYCNVGRDYLPELLADRGLASVTPEALVRFVRSLAAELQGTYVIIDGLEPLLCMWAVGRARVLPNFFLALGRAIVDRPLLVVAQTSPAHLPYETLMHRGWWPVDRQFRLCLSQRDKETVAKNWGVDPMRGRISANLYELLASRLEG